MGRNTDIVYTEKLTGRQRIIKLSKLVKNPKIHLESRIACWCMAVAMVLAILFGLNAALN